MKYGVVIPDGNDAVRTDLPAVIELIARTARWVSPQTFQRLPVWCPEIARTQPLYNSAYTDRYMNTKRSSGITSEKFEGNVAALKALVAALDVQSPKPANWTVCHIWGYDDPAFASASAIVQDPRYYSCVANMVWLPTALKAFSDTLPEVKEILRTCAFHLYGWACEHQSVAKAAERVRSGHLPSYYPQDWPSPARSTAVPGGVSPFSERIETEIEKRKARWKFMLNSDEFPNYPRDQVRSVLNFWQVPI